MSLDNNNLKIHLLKTQIKTEEEKFLLNSILNNNLAIIKWNIDLDDCDKVLRIVSDALSLQEIINLLQSNHLFCEEL